MNKLSDDDLTGTKPGELFSNSPFSFLPPYPFFEIRGNTDWAGQWLDY